jgi:Spy/CpxP family protein refolding chaperone
MHPAFYWWFNHGRRHAREHCGPSAGCGPSHGGGGGREEHFYGAGPHPGHIEEVFKFSREGDGEGFFGGGGGPFGVRRPLRFLAHKLELSEPQTAELARILDELKTERAQAGVDHRRTVAAFADAVESATFGEPRAKEGGEQRVKSAERLRDAVVKALSQIHAMLDDEQRKRLAYLIRTGVLSL